MATQAWERHGSDDVPQPKFRGMLVEGLTAAVKRDSGYCIECGDPVYIVPPNEETAWRAGVETSVPLLTAYSPIAWSEKLKYTREHSLAVPQMYAAAAPPTRPDERVPARPLTRAVRRALRHRQ